ncbi:MAG: glutathione S-transferase family protein [Prochloraceae cyanobacterium]|nr:glutathione S-transferase family protein [Prochloraceae cyanobacterium]
MTSIKLFHLDFYYFLFFHYVYYPFIFLLVRLLLLKSNLFPSKTHWPQPILHTLPYSHYCEKVRWALDLQNEIYLERPHGLMTYAPFSLYYTQAKYRKVPILVLEDNITITGSTDILLYFYEKYPDQYKWLYPNPEVKEIERYLDVQLGEPVMGLIYAIFFNRQNTHTLSCWRSNLERNIPDWESLMFNVIARDFRFVIESNQGPFHSDIKIFLDTLEEVFSHINKLLEERTYLANTSHITAADITFASLSLPLLCPEKMEDLYIKSSDFPRDFQKIIEKFRQTKAGQFALKLYENERTRGNQVQIKKLTSLNA